MKKLKNTSKLLLIIGLLLVNITQVNAKEVDSVSDSLKIYVPFDVIENKVQIFLDIALKSNNEKVNYQVVELTEDQLANVREKSSNMTEDYYVCDATVLDNHDYITAEENRDAIKSELEEAGEDYATNENYIAAQQAYTEAKEAYDADVAVCTNTYNTSLNGLYSELSAIDDTKWVESAIVDEDEGYVYYDITLPTDKTNYIIWVKAKDTSNNDIKGIIYENPESNTASLLPVTDEDDNETIGLSEEYLDTDVDYDTDNDDYDDYAYEDDDYYEEVEENPETGIKNPLMASVGIITIASMGLIILKNKKILNK